MEIVSAKDVYETDKRDTRKMFLKTDAICTKCGVIINSNYEDTCMICNDHVDPCDHSEFITGHQSVNLRILLDFPIEDLRALAELHGCSEGSGRTKTVAGIMKKLHSDLDHRINDTLIRKIVLRNRKKFWFWKDIDSEMKKVRRPNVKLVDAKDVKRNKRRNQIVKVTEIVKIVTITPLGKGEK